MAEKPEDKAVDTLIDDSGTDDATLKDSQDDLRKTVERLEQQGKESQAKITELATDNATMRARIDATVPEEAEPVYGGDTVAQEPNSAELERRINKNTRDMLALKDKESETKLKLKDENLSHWEQQVFAECNRKHDYEKLDWDTAIEKTIEEFKKKREIDIKATQLTETKTEEPLPSGAQAENGANTPPPPPPAEEKEETRSEFVKKKEDARLRKNYPLR